MEVYKMLPEGTLAEIINGSSQMLPAHLPIKVLFANWYMLFLVTSDCTKK